MNIREAYSIMGIGVQFFRHIFKKIFFVRSPGLKAFLNAYKGDRIRPISPEDKKLLVALASCVGCGLCDSVDKNGGSTSYAVRTLSRSIVDFPPIPVTLSGVETLLLGEKICPAGVPIVKGMEILKNISK